MEESSSGPINRQHKDQPQAPKRLRSTCDRCTVLKVRCDKKKPRCERCESVQQQCVYGPYRWKGRSAATHAAPSKSCIRRGGPCPPRALESLAQTATPNTQMNVSVIPEDPVNAMSDCSLFSGLETLSFDVQGDLDGIYIGLSDDDSKALAGPSARGEYLGAATDNVSHLPETQTSASPSGHEPHPMLDTGMSESSFSSPDSWTTRNMCPCATLAFSILQSMYRDEFTYRMERGCDLPSSDLILKINRAAVQSLHQLLSRDCPECFRDTTIRFLIVTIISKVLSWYRAVFDRLVHQSPAKSPIDLAELSSVTPIHFGDFELDMVAEQRITAQLLLCELDNVHKVLSLMRHSALGRTHNGPDVGDTLVGVVCQFLSSAFGDLTSQVDEFCLSKPSFTFR